MECFVCERIHQLENQEVPMLIRELETGYVVLGDFQYIEGYTVFICKQHKTELFDLEPEFRHKFMDEMVMTAEAVARAFKAEKMNYELLGTGNGVHMHWHLFPRHAGDTPSPGPVWAVPASIRQNDAVRPDPERREQLKARIKAELDWLIEDRKIR